MVQCVSSAQAFCSLFVLQFNIRNVTSLYSCSVVCTLAYTSGYSCHALSAKCFYIWLMRLVWQVATLNLVWGPWPEALLEKGGGGCDATERCIDALVALFFLGTKEKTGLLSTDSTQTGQRKINTNWKLLPCIFIFYLYLSCNVLWKTHFS